MAFAITNKPNIQFTAGLPIAHLELADKITTQTADCGVAGLKFIQGRIRVKAFGADNTQCSFVVKVSTVAGLTTPEVVFQSPTYIAAASTDTGLNIDFTGWSNGGFRYISVTPTTATGAITYDTIIDAV